VVSEEDVHYFIDRIRIEALPDVDLDELAKGSDPAGLLAQKILLIRGPENEKRRDLLDEAARRLRATVEQPSYSALSEKRLDESQVAALLEQAAVRALDQLLAQREAAA
jgi:hypothetical protein